MGIPIEDRAFDINEGYDPVRDVRPVLTSEIEAINWSIRNILQTDVGERVRNRDVGSDLKPILFDELTENNALDLLDEISRILEQFIKRIDVLTNQSTVDVNTTSRMYDILVVYRIIRSNQIQEFSFSIPVKK